MKKSLIIVLLLMVGNVFGQSSDDFDITQNAQGGITITGYRGTIRDVVIPEAIEGIKVMEINGGVFSNRGLTSVVIPNSIISIGGGNPFFGGNGAFQGNQLTSLIIPDSVTTIQSMAFQDNQLVNVTIGNGVTAIGSQAFGNNPLMSITIGANVELYTTNNIMGQPSFGNLGFETNYNNGGRQAGTYIRIDTGSRRWGRQFDNFLVIGTRAITIVDYTGVGGDLTIPSTIENIPVTTIGAEAFLRIQITSIIIPESVTNIGNNAFPTNNLTSITIPANVNYANLFPHNFNAFYQSQDRRAGTYTWSGRVWSVR